MPMARRASLKKRASPYTDQAQMSRKLDSSLNPTMESGKRRSKLEKLMQQMLVNEVEPGNPSLDIPRYLGDRWSPLILLVLTTGTFRHTELQRVINLLSEINKTTTISQHVLTRKLRALEREGLIDRKVWAVVPPRTDYSLSPMGEQLMNAWWKVLHWINANAHRIVLARQRFDMNAKDY